MNRAKLITMAFISIFSAGCDLTTGVKKSTKPQPILAVIAIDGSGSYDFLNRAKRTASNIIRGLPANSKVYVRWISDESSSDKNSIASAMIPDTKPPKNPFDVKGKKRHQALKARRNQVFNEVMKAIENAKSPRAEQTDIYGALFAASERFIGSAGTTPLLILLTDMIDNVKAKDAFTINLNNAQVKILNYQVDPKGNGQKRVWTEYLTGVGAASVEFSHIDEPLLFTEGGQ